MRLPDDHLVSLGERLRQITIVLLQEQRERTPRRASRQTVVVPADSDAPLAVTICA
jgi:hypothetical protein